MESIECPYCTFELEDTIDDFEEGEDHKFTCPKCEKIFAAELIIERYYNISEMDQPEEEIVDCEGQTFFGF